MGYNSYIQLGWNRAVVPNFVYWGFRTTPGPEKRQTAKFQNLRPHTHLSDQGYATVTCLRENPAVRLSEVPLCWKLARQVITLVVVCKFEA